MEEATAVIKHFERLRPFVKSVTTVKLDQNRLFSLCLRASFSKSFDFVDFALNKPDEHRAFFDVAALRSICEDVIYLSYGASLKHRDRETLIKGKMLLELHEKIHRQVKFFDAFRILQPVLRGGASSKGLQEANDELFKVWSANGFPNLQQGRSPTTRQIAETVDPGILGIVYDYFFRLTSSMVHFNPQHLLRTGWGDFRNTTFSTRSMGPYFVAVAQTYGIFLFCLYFEYFARFLKPGAKNQSHVTALREEIIMRSRWPEMITFEEMNVQLPDTNPFEILGRVMQAEQTKRGFLAAARN